MNEVEKMYRNSGIEKHKKTMLDIETGKDVLTLDSFYPEFTAEKQLEITKFLLKKAVYYDVKDDKYWFYYEECESAGYKPFDEAIAHFINKLWQDLTEADKQQIRGILE